MASGNITHHFIAYTREEVVAYLERSPIYFFVAETEETIVGYINGSVHDEGGPPVLAAKEPYFEIDNVYVKSEFRGQGVGAS